MNKTVEARVSNGAKFLDEVAPGWEDRIDLATLDLKLGTHCICGQTFSSEVVLKEGNGFNYALSIFTEGAAWVRAWTKAAGKSRFLSWEVAEALGFAIDLDDPIQVENDDESWNELQETWVALIKERANLGIFSGNFGGGSEG